MTGRVIVITSGKGGVGKTTTSANIGTALAKEGYKVVLCKYCLKYILDVFRSDSVDRSFTLFVIINSVLIVVVQCADPV